MNAGLVAQALLRHINVFQLTVIPECTVRCSRGMKTVHGGNGWPGYEYEDWFEYRADFMMVSVAGYATEIEVKVSKSDWKCDLVKEKWASLPSWITRFIYCVPEELGIPDWVPEFAGVWHICQDHRGGLWVKVVRAPKKLGKEKPPEDVVKRWTDVFYSRFWHQRYALNKRIPVKVPA
jgi:hypothetical protein